MESRRRKAFSRRTIHLSRSLAGVALRIYALVRPRVLRELRGFILRGDRSILATKTFRLPRTRSRERLGVGSWRLGIGSIASIDDPFANRQKPVIVDARFAERTLRAVETIRGHAARRVEAVQRRVGRLSRRGIFARRLPEVGCNALDVENVVHDLERQPEFGSGAVDRTNAIV